MPNRMNTLLRRELSSCLENKEGILFFNYAGLKAPELDDLRRTLSTNHGKMLVAKNTLLRLALKDTGASVSDQVLQGSTAIVLATGDPSAVARALVQWYKKQSKELVLKGGVLGQTTLSPQEVKALADLPPRAALLGQLAASLVGPLTQLTWTLNEIVSQFPRILKAIADKQGGTQ